MSAKRLGLYTFDTLCYGSSCRWLCLMLCLGFRRKLHIDVISGRDNAVTGMPCVNVFSTTINRQVMSRTSRVEAGTPLALPQ